MIQTFASNSETLADRIHPKCAWRVLHDFDIGAFGDSPPLTGVRLMPSCLVKVLLNGPLRTMDTELEKLASDPLRPQSPLVGAPYLDVGGCKPN
ncbi:MAG TPA: hypothetical protein VIV60_23495 [Polyangiaceae bacterium]